MFAATPVWDRKPKGRRFGNKAPRVTPPAGDTLSGVQAEPTVGRRLRSPPGGATPVALTAGVALAALVVAGGWYALQPREGVPTLAPGEPTRGAMEVAVNSPAIPDIPAAAITPTPASAPDEAATQIAPPAPRPEAARVNRVRPAPTATSAESLGTDASATLPEAPMPYSAMAPAPGAVNPLPAPVIASPSPLDTSPAPAVVTPAPTPEVAPTAPADIPATSINPDSAAMP